MLMPDKHVRLSESLYGLGGYLLELLKAPATVDDLWRRFSKSVAAKEFPSGHSFEDIVLAVDFLYAIGAISLNESGVLEKCA